MYLVVDEGADDVGREEAARDYDDPGGGHRAAPTLVGQLAHVHLQRERKNRKFCRIPFAIHEPGS